MLSRPDNSDVEEMVVMGIEARNGGEQELRYRLLHNRLHDEAEKFRLREGTRKWSDATFEGSTVRDLCGWAIGARKPLLIQ